MLGQCRLRHHILALLRRRPRPQEEQEALQAPAAAHEPPQQRGGQKGEIGNYFDQSDQLLIHWLAEVQSNIIHILLTPPWEIKDTPNEAR